MLTKEEKQKLLEEKEKNHHKLNKLNERISEINEILEEERRCEIEQCTIILEDTLKYCTHVKTCIKETYMNELIGIPMVQEVYYANVIYFNLKNKGREIIVRSNFALLIQIDNYKATIYLENSDGKILGEVKEVYHEWGEE